MNRRELMLRGAVAIAGALNLRDSPRAAQPDFQVSDLPRVRIHPIKLELAPGVTVRTLGCEGTVTGPIIRVRPTEGIGIHVTNDADCSISVKGLGIDQDLHMAVGERGTTRFLPNNSALVCPQTRADGAALDSVGGIAGLFVRPNSSRAVDQLHHLTIHHWLPSLSQSTGALLGPAVTYRYASLGDRLLSAGEPIRVRQGQRVLFHFFNASPSKSVTLSLPNHRFLVLALDGYEVPRAREVNQVALGPGERVEAIVNMTSPGRFVLGSIDRRDRDAGFGRVVEYSNARGPALHAPLAPSAWDYSYFGGGSLFTSGDITVVPVTLKAANYKEEIRTESHRLRVDSGRRYRLSMVNATGERHRVALRGHNFELKAVAGVAVQDIVKDTIALPSFARTEIEFVAAQSAVDLLHPSTAAVTTSGS